LLIVFIAGFYQLFEVTESHVCILVNEVISVRNEYIVFAFRSFRNMGGLVDKFGGFELCVEVVKGWIIDNWPIVWGFSFIDT